MKQKEPNNIKILTKRKPDFPYSRPFGSKNKIHLGTIPSKYENILIEPPKTSNKNGFISNSLRINPNFEGDRNPGIGEYDINKSYTAENIEKNNIFITNKIRFKGFGSYFQEKTNPSPCDYNSSKTSSIEYISKHSLIGQSLYNSKKSKSLKKHITFPDPFTYSPKKYDNWKLENKNFRYNFDSSSKRDFVTINKTYSPGPCYYFKTQYKKKDLLPKIIEESCSDRKIKDLKNLKKYSIKTEQSKSDAKFQLKNKGNSGKYSQYITNMDRLAIAHQIQNYNIDNINKSIYKEFSNKVKDKDELTSKIKFKIEEEKELDYIKQILGNDNAKPDLFYLASPRWKKNIYETKVPGPAYYVPKNIKDKYSYNRSTNLYMCPKGPEYYY